MEKQLSVRKMITADHLDTMTKWMYDWWGKAENNSYEAVYSYMLHSLQEKRLPQTYGLFLDEKMIGMYQFTITALRQMFDAILRCMRVHHLIFSARIWLFSPGAVKRTRLTPAFSHIIVNSGSR